jgi:predicted transcriptional regulator
MAEEKIVKIFEKKNTGRSITELVSLSKLSRSAIRTAIARLEGANKIYFRNIGMAKVYFLNQRNAKRKKIIASKKIKRGKKTRRK